MLGVGSSIWNRALAGKGAGDGGNPPAEATPIHSLDLTTAPSASNAFDDYGLSTSRTVTDYSGRIVEMPANAVPMGGLRPVENLLAVLSANSSDLTEGWTATTSASIDDNETITFLTSSDTVRPTDLTGIFKTGRTYVMSADVCSVAATGKFRFRFGKTTDASGDIDCDSTYKRYSFTKKIIDPTPGTSPHLYAPTTGADVIKVKNIQVQDITHRADLSTAPDEYVSTDDDYGTGVNGFRYFDTELANTVASNVVTEGTGASIDGWLDYQPGDTNYADCTHDFSGGADTITLTATGNYTLWLEGTAQVTIAAGTATITGAGAATEGSPVTINCTATGTVTLTLDSGTLDEWGAYKIIQLNDGTVPTAFIPSTGSASRPAMSPAPTISGLVGTEDARLTVKGLAADLVTPDPTDTTERTLDVDNTDGEFDTLPSPIKVLSIDVYNDGERPA